MSCPPSLPTEDITAFILDCADNYLTVDDPFLSHPMKDEDDEHDNEDAAPASLQRSGDETVASSAFFSLHEAMAASQLMDRKMDCCEIPAHLVAPWHAESDDRMVYPRPIPTFLDDPMTPLPWNDLTIKSAAFISIEIIVRLQSLVSGSSVGESTFTCLYAHSAILQDMKSRLLPSVDTKINCNSIDMDAYQPDSLESRLKALQLDSEDVACARIECHPLVATTDAEIAQWCIFACSLALVELTDSVRSIILNADIYEEEDFVSNTHNLPFYILRSSTDRKISHSSDDSAINVHPKRCEDWNTLRIIERALQNLDSLPSSDYTTILRLVLGYQADFIYICSTMGCLSDRDLQSTIEATQARVHQAVDKLGKLQSVVIAQSTVNVDESNHSQWVQLLLQRCFDSHMNRVLVGNLPIRKISFQQPAVAIATMNTITSEVDTCVCNLLLHGSTLGRIHRMLDRAATTNILSRSMLLLNLYFNEKLLGQFEMRGLLIQHMVQWQSSPDGTLLSSDDAMAFIDRLAKPVYDTLKLKLLNRNRQRAYIDVVMLPEWILIQNEANLADYHLQKESATSSATNALHGNSNPSTYFTRYVLSILLRLMDRYVEAGLEVGLFLNNQVDLSFAYWYRDFLLSALNQNLSVLRQKADAEATEAASVTPTTAKANNASMTKPKGKKKHVKNKVTTPNGRHNDTDVDARPLVPLLVNLEDELELKVIAVKRSMCRKTIQFLTGLEQVGILKEQRFEFTSMQRIFEDRFEVFAGIRQPPPLTFQDFQEGNDFSAVPSGELFQAVTEGFQHCRSFLEHILLETNQSQINPMYMPISESELRALLKVCLGNVIYVQKVHQIEACGGAAKAKVIFDFGSHPQFCIVKVAL